MTLVYNNIFEAGQSPEKAAELKLIADLMRAISTKIRELKLSPAESLTRLGVSKEELSDIMNWRVEKSDAANLQAILMKLG